MNTIKFTKLTTALVASLIVGCTAVTANASTKYNKDNQFKNAKVVKITHYKKTRYTVKKTAKPIRIYRTSSLKSYSKSSNINVFYSKQSRTIQKSTGSKAVYRSVVSSTGKTVGWVWRGNMNPTNKVAHTTSTTKPSTSNSTSHINKPITSGSLGVNSGENSQNPKRPLTQNVSNTNYYGYKNVKTLRDAINKLGDIISNHPSAWNNSGYGSNQEGALQAINYIYSNAKDLYLNTLPDKSTHDKDMQKTIDSQIKDLNYVLKDAKY